MVTCVEYMVLESLFSSLPIGEYSISRLIDDSITMQFSKSPFKRVVDKQKPLSFKAFGHEFYCNI